MMYMMIYLSLSRRIGLEGLFGLVAAIQLQGLFDFLAQELAVLQHIAGT